MKKIFAIVPVKKFENAKLRLALMLSADDRIHLSALMLDDTLSALAGAKSIDQVVVVSSDRRAKEIAIRHDRVFLREDIESGVNSAVALADHYCTGQGVNATAVIPQDLPLLDGLDVDKACDMAENEQSCIIICPSLRYDGTNLLLRKPPTAIKTHYDHDSYETHIKAAGKMGIPVKIFLSNKLMSDLDTPEDARQLAMEAGAGKTLEFIKSKLGNP
jgi:2-phospho-L-lactate/phosphoenolpyruvate guanylyltransferase